MEAGLFEDAAKTRASEAKTLEVNDHLCGAVYLAGYVVECRLKALLSKMGKPFPRSGSQGHNLQGLWDSAGLRSRDLQGHKRAFMETWTTSMRYSAALPPGHGAKELLEGARDLASMVSTRMRNTRGARGRR